MLSMMVGLILPLSLSIFDYFVQNNPDYFASSETAIKFFLFFFPAILVDITVFVLLYRWLLRHPGNRWIKLSPDGQRLVESG